MLQRGTGQHGAAGIENEWIFWNKHEHYRYSNCEQHPVVIVDYQAVFEILWGWTAQNPELKLALKSQRF